MRLRAAGRSLVIVAGLGIVGERGAAAQSLSPPGPSERHGLFVSAGVGVAKTSPEVKCFVDFDASDAVEGCGGAALTVDGGWRFSRRLGATLHLATSGPLVRSGVHHITAVTVQYWPTSHLWLRAGAGWGGVDDVVGDRDRRHLAVIAATGYELWRARRPGKHGEGTLDAQMRVFVTGGGPDVRTTSVSLSLAVGLLQTRSQQTVEARR